ncbi:DNA topoisomerase IV subunit A [Clostridium sp. BJN0001]|uniref:DNA topoisomerase IV subunit A n=1 Tax=Clostridium sp. BJN0001 TaxID=2930219 RepID=UPI001FD12EC5|nr:DNA topoisomerase IV subunit A [Clostridium sp. BJN0001]
MAKKKIVAKIPKDNNIVDVSLEDAMPENYLPYAIEVAKDRALPDVRDGLKPVHRRILYGAYMLKAFPDKPYYKSARIVGDILGKYHPHGDTSVYDAMVILAQNFTTRVPLIDGHGNWGSIDGDSAAAMRYTEARLTKEALLMLRDIDKDTVDMTLNYSDSELEPVVLPSRYPNLLVNGAFGIAVGLATNIPPHNLHEVIDGTLNYIDNNDITTKELMKYIKGPDLPTGGILIGEDSILSAYETGEGKIAYRAKTSIEKLENGRFGIVITEFPYRRNKSKILQTISEMTADKRYQKSLDSISDIRDESDRDGIRAVIEFKKNTDEQICDKVLKFLFKKTDLQCNLSVNMVAIADGKPQTMGLKTIIKYYVEHQKDVIKRRTKKELQTCRKRYNIVEGFIKAISVMDDIIKIIRASKSKKDAEENIINKYDFTVDQANAILELMLYRLTGLEIDTLKKEYESLKKKIKALEKILSSEKELLKVIKKELSQIQEEYKDDRRTKIVKDDDKGKIEIEDIIVSEDIVISVSKDGFVKRIPLKNYNKVNKDKSDIDYREGDYLKFVVKSNTVSNLLFFTDKGSMYQTKGINIPEMKWKEKGEKLDGIIKTLKLSKENIIGVISTDVLSEDMVVKFITRNGFMKESSLNMFATNYSKIQAIKLKDDDILISVILKEDDKEYNFLKINTLSGLEFTADVPKIPITARNIMPQKVFNFGSYDYINTVEYVSTMDYFEMNLGITEKGILKSYSKIKNSPLKTKITSSDELLIFTSKGIIHKIKAFMLKNVINSEISVEKFIGKLLRDEKIIRICTADSKLYSKGNSFYIFTKNGIVKETYIDEFKDNFENAVFIKFKSDDDEVVSVDIGREKTGYVLIFTSKAMAIRFPCENLSPMGKGASGVTGISLRDEDEVINAVFVSENKKAEIALSSKEKKEIMLFDIKLQNRAGIGSSIMLLNLDDKVKNITIN